MERKWYYKLMGDVVGPLSADELREHAFDGQIERDTPIRKGVDGSWILADKVQGLLDSRPRNRPKATRRRDKSLAVSRLRIRRLRLGLIGLVAVGAVILTVVLSLNGRRGTPEAEDAEARQKAGPARHPRKDGTFSVETVASGGITVVQVTFRKLPSSTTQAATIVREALENAVAKDGGREILAMAFNSSGDALADAQYGGPLTYKPDGKSIMTMDERRGVQSTTNDNGAYFLKVTEEKTYEGITPARKWLTCKLVFAAKPSGATFKDAALAEIDRLKHRQLDITLYAYVGDKSNSATWEQCRADKSKYMKIEYEAKSGSNRTNW